MDCPHPDGVLDQALSDLKLSDRLLADGRRIALSARKRPWWAFIHRRAAAREIKEIVEDVLIIEMRTARRLAEYRKGTS